MTKDDPIKLHQEHLSKLREKLFQTRAMIERAAAAYVSSRYLLDTIEAESQRRQSHEN